MLEVSRVTFNTMHVGAIKTFVAFDFKLMDKLLTTVHFHPAGKHSTGQSFMPRPFSCSISDQLPITRIQNSGKADGSGVALDHHFRCRMEHMCICLLFPKPFSKYVLRCR